MWIKSDKTAKEKLYKISMAIKDKLTLTNYDKGFLPDIFAFKKIQANLILIIKQKLDFLSIL